MKNTTGLAAKREIAYARCKPMQDYVLFKDGPGFIVKCYIEINDSAGFSVWFERNGCLGQCGFESQTQATT